MSKSLYRVELEGPAGRLEAVHTLPAAPARGAALVCHAHPQYGGSMHTKAVYRTARALLDAGCEVLRFNFRGVGRSAGSFHGGHGELDDARAALGWLRQRPASKRTLLAGFSFGSYVALRLAAERDDLIARVAVGVPLELYDFAFVAAGGAPLLLVAGASDPFCTPEALKRLGRRVGRAAQVEILPGAGHLLLEAQAELHATVATFARTRLDAPA